MNVYSNEKNSCNILKAQRLEKIECVPIHFSDQLDFLGGWLGIDRQLYHLNAEIMLNAQIKFNERFSGTGILGPNFGVALEASSFGAEIRFTKENPPWVIEVCKNYDDLADYVNHLKEPNPLFHGLLPLFYQNYFYFQKITNNKVAPPMGVLASFDVASLLVGMENLCLAVKLDPETAHKLLSKINKFLINFIETKAKLFGVSDIEVIDIYGDNSAFLSRDDFKEFVLPYNKAIYDYFANDKSIKLYHCDGEMDHLINLIPQMGCNCLYSFDAHTDLQKFVDQIRNEVCLIGNIDPIKVLRNGTVEDVKIESKRLLEIGKKAKGFVLSTGGELANGTPEENIDALIETVSIYGKND